MGNEKAKRIQTSILNAAEKKALIWLVERQPRWMTSDKLTAIGVFGSVLTALGFVLANLNLQYLWISILGLVINWYGDSLDGTLARVRKTPRPVYGFFIDHTLDAFTQAIMFIGAGLSPAFRLDVTLLVLGGYLLLSVYTYIGAILKNEFKLTYGSIGPTEFRLIIVLLNLLIMYLPWQKWNVECLGETFGVFDIVGLLIAAILFIMYMVQFDKDRRAFAIQDPLPNPPTDEEK